MHGWKTWSPDNDKYASPELDDDDDDYDDDDDDEFRH